MKEVSLTRGYTTTVSDRDYPALSKFNWFVKITKRNLYAARRDGKNTSLLMHRVILGVTDPRIEVDHRNGCGLNNQRRNLRCSTPTQNRRAHRSKAKQSTSKYRGVRLHYGKWQARIGVGKNILSLGVFPSQELAAKAYDAAALKHFGEFAAPNFKP